MKDLHMKDLQPWANDSVTTITTIRFSKSDRLNLLLFGQLRIELQTLQEHRAGRTETVDCLLTVESLPRVLRVLLWKLRGAPLSYAEAAPPPVGAKQEEAR